MENNKDFKKNNGIYYTPDKLADYLINDLNIENNNSILDPSYGEGALLLAVERLAQAKKISNLNLFGCDLHPINGLLLHLPEVNLIEVNFFDYNVNNKFDFIISNPPYIRRQNQDKKEIDVVLTRFKEMNLLGKNADMWAYFIIKSMLHLNKGGSFCAIIPWAFIQADYAQKLRILLYDKFETIKVIALNKPYFESIDERVVLFWGYNFGEKNTEILFSYLKDLKSKPNFKKIDNQVWSSNKIVLTKKNEVKKNQEILIKKFGFQKIEDFVEIRIGVVTGANEYFIRTYEELISYGFTKKDLMPILTKAKEIPDYINNKLGKLKFLVKINEDYKNQFSNFIEEGIGKEFNKRVHCKNRNIWYSINTAKVPDAFFPYRVGKIPYLFFNNHQIQSTNSIHRIYYKRKLNKTEEKWIQVSMLSIYGQISIEMNAKTYGKGMLKMEPGPLKNALVKISNDKSIVKTFNQIRKLLIDQRKDEVVLLATSFLNEKLIIPKEIHIKSIKLYEDIRKSREK
ncbi:N-6 DNA methylase [Polaribacter pectinis]|uniref:site-specific DNA-methyltransferase (adenine-specific) n=1 Tax=Polaribacter pectinis TaxID=2738844 RepID=A0A7G9LBJ2_9FLAO|nr:N-6 DNA methylase [Polaribacter pectinis]QNM85991.1 N-6 DNA methylase [Polaribacter pectinis]